MSYQVLGCGLVQVSIYSWIGVDFVLIEAGNSVHPSKNKVNRSTAIAVAQHLLISHMQSVPACAEASKDGNQHLTGQTSSELELQNQNLRTCGHLYVGHVQQ